MFEYILEKIIFYQGKKILNKIVQNNSDLYVNLAQERSRFRAPDRKSQKSTTRRDSSAAHIPADQQVSSLSPPTSPVCFYSRLY